MQDLDELVGFVLVQICRAHRNEAETVLCTNGLHTGQEIIVLHLWSEDGRSQTELGGCLGVEPPTISKMVQRMERQGLVERRPDPEDARVSRVYLTPRGRAAHEPALRMWHELETRMLAGLTPAEQMLLRR